MRTDVVLTRPSEIAAIVARESAETLVGSAGGLRGGALRVLLRPAAHLVARRFARYDRVLGDRGPHDGASWIVREATGGLDVQGNAHVPRSGPLLVVANHPGVSDAVSLLAALGRDDVWLVAANYPFLHALRRANRRFLFVPDGCAGRLVALRRIARRLRDGDAVLLFPAGGLEPDPAVAPQLALASLARWSRSIELIARLASRALIVPALVRGAVSRSAFAHPLARRRSVVADRQRVAALLQLAVPTYQREPVSVRFGTPLAAQTPRLRDAVTEAMRELMGGA